MQDWSEMVRYQEPSILLRLLLVARSISRCFAIIVWHYNTVDVRDLVDTCQPDSVVLLHDELTVWTNFVTLPQLANEVDSQDAGCNFMTQALRLVQQVGLWYHQVK